MKDIEKILKALANRRRLAIIKYLNSPHEAAVGDIATAIKLSLKATSKHLVILHNVDILEREQRSLLMYYRLADSLPKLARSIIHYL